MSFYLASKYGSNQNTNHSKLPIRTSFHTIMYNNHTSIPLSILVPHHISIPYNVKMRDKNAPPIPHHISTSFSEAKSHDAQVLKYVNPNQLLTKSLQNQRTCSILFSYHLSISCGTMKASHRARAFPWQMEVP
ncbi:hypothetical protein JHK85_026516 [Glycine max]|nr:hypothetical protein JHK87_025848 [Glycine soja]KAG5007974.1 hypothetical protein JHK85_026516 [Glycine max]KHN11718.1 hypothetical protein glysoja_006171 [Glycine soja]